MKPRFGLFGAHVIFPIELPLQAVFSYSTSIHVLTTEYLLQPPLPCINI